ncbi:MAG TPA: hypothetical protein PLP29_05555 [Candidatus Ozemobacteraceae bacterium]|nr:hypothetical protein [Candidatus Ozemobacteraceae bacterium]
MKRFTNVLFPFALCAAFAFLSVTGVAAEAPSRTPLPPLAALHVAFPPDAIGSDLVVAAFPELKDELRNIEDVVRKHARFLPDRDLSEFRVYLLDGGTPGSLTDESFLFAVKGRFDEAALLPQLPQLLFTLEKGSRGEGIVRAGNRSLVRGARMTAFFAASDTLCLATHKTATALVERGVSMEAGLELPAGATNSPLFLHVDIARLLERDPELKAKIQTTPEGIRLMLNALRQGRFTLESGVMRLGLDFASSNGVEVGASLFDSFRSIGLAKLQEESASLDQKVATMEPSALLSEWRIRKTMLAIGTALLKRVSIEKSATGLTITMRLPDAINGANPLLVTSTVSVLAAIAIPNFHRARTMAQKNACFANQRILLSAIDIYNLDNTTPKTSLSPEDYGPAGILLLKGYLSDGLHLPTPECSYSSEGDLGKGGYITCGVHGSFFEK